MQYRPRSPLFGEAAAAEARYFDIALLGWEAGNPTSRASSEAVIFGAGRPAVLLPELIAIGSIDHVAIAWDGSRVAARAMADATPFLERASKISVLTVVDEKPLKEGAGGERLAIGLKKRGLVAEWISIRAEDCPIGVSLQEHAIERGAKLLVMGGYGHSRVRDFVLGGATQGRARGSATASALFALTIDQSSVLELHGCPAAVPSANVQARTAGIDFCAAACWRAARCRASPVASHEIRALVRY